MRRSPAKHEHPVEYRAWKNMRSRCSPTNRDHRWYYDKGVRVCSSWDSFEVFLADVGLRPSPDHSLDRVDGTKNYEPGNVRWADSATQRRNRSSVKLTPELAAEVRRRYADGETQVAIAASLGMTQPGLNHVIRGRSWV